MPTYYWEFMGPRSELIAKHHAEHLNEFLEREKVEGCEVTVEKESPMRALALITVPEALAAQIEKALRPPRKRA